MGEIDDAVDGGVDGLKTVVDADDVGEPLQNKMKSSISQLSFCLIIILHYITFKIYILLHIFHYYYKFIDICGYRHCFFFKSSLKKYLVLEISLVAKCAGLKRPLNVF